MESLRGSGLWLHFLPVCALPSEHAFHRQACVRPIGQGSLHEAKFHLRQHSVLTRWRNDVRELGVESPPLLPLLLL